jgi:phosphoglycolate phosphatase-like HAD superfamily hydrolase|tara:strand:- start:194 stop:841 length:648 start_codon:yes stop_codon:yes gene_type:complete
MLKAIILDFDGVIIESMEIKTDAFRELFKESPEHLDAILEYHLKHGGVSRYTKFSYIYKNILKQPLDEGELEKLGEKFSKLVMEKVMQCPLTLGTLEFLGEYYKKLSLYIASGTPERELRTIVKHHGMLKYFRGVYGTPALKSEIINMILEVDKFKKNDVLFIGDSLTDYEEARKVNVPFIGFVNDTILSNPFSGLQIPLVKNFNVFRKTLEGHI